jgi:hypothetical protein
VVSHTLFSLFANPIRYIWVMSAGHLGISVIFFLWSLVRLFLGQVSVFTLIISLSFTMLAIMFFAFGVITQQEYTTHKEIWLLKKQLNRMEAKLMGSSESHERH